MIPKTAVLVSLAAALCAAAGAPPAPQWPAAPDPARLKFVAEFSQLAPLEPPKTRGFGAWLKLLLGIEGAEEEQAKAEALRQPTGLCARAGILYVADPGRPGVLRYELERKTGRWLGAREGLALSSPVAVAVSGDGRIYVADSLLEKVLILDQKGKQLGELHGDPQGLGRPAGLAVSGRRVYVSDVRGHRIGVYGLEGLFVSAFGRRGLGPGELNFPTYLWFDARDNQLWVTDSENFRLQWFDPDGRPLGAFGQGGNRPGYLPRPRGVARDSDGHVYVSDGAFDALQLFDTKGRLLLFAGVSGRQPGEFDLPGGLSIDESDRVYVADTQNRRIQIFQYLKEGSR